MEYTQATGMPVIGWSTLKATYLFGFKTGLRDLLLMHFGSEAHRTNLGNASWRSSSGIAVMRPAEHCAAQRARRAQHGAAARGRGPARAGGARRPHQGQQAVQGHLGAGAGVLDDMGSLGKDTLVLKL